MNLELIFMLPFFQRVIVRESARLVKKIKQRTGSTDSEDVSKQARHRVVSITYIIKGLILISLGIFAAAFGLKGFLLPSHFVDGGVTGISLLLQAHFKVSLSWFIVLINIPFILLAFTQVGKRFAIRSITSILGLAIVVAFVDFPEITKDNWNGGVQVEDFPNTNKYTDDMKWNSPLPMAPMTMLSASTARSYVLSNAGAILPRRDAVDSRIVTQVSTGKIAYLPNVTLPETQFKHRRLPIDSYKVGIITEVAQVGGYPEYKGKPHADADLDGLPDAWEKKNGLNPADPTDATKDRDKDGYSNIEEYLNSLVDVTTVAPVQPKKK